MMRAFPAHQPILPMGLIGVMAGLPSLLLHLVYILPVEASALGKVLICVSALSSSGLMHLLAFRVGGRSGLLAFAFLNAPLAILLGVYGLAFTDAPSLYSLAHLTQEAAGVAGAWALYIPWLLGVAILLSLVALYYLGRISPRPPTSCLVVLATVWVVCVTASFWPLHVGSGRRHSIQRHIQGLYLNTLEDAWNAFRTWDDRLLVKAIEKDRQEHPHVLLGQTTLHSRILILQLESLDLNALGFRFKGKPVLPFLDSLSSTIPPLVMDPNHFGSSGTGGIDFQVLTGLRPLTPKPVYELNRMDWSRSLPWEFQRRGIPFWALHGNDGNYWNRKSAFTKMGMMAFLDRDHILVPKDTRWGVSDAVTFRKTVETARNHPGPMALFVITLTSHTPFDYAPAGSFPGTAPMERYFNSIAYLDSCLASLFRDLPMDSPWTVIMYGDHPSRMEGMGYQSLVDGKERVPCWIFEWTSEGPKPMAFPKLTEKQRRDGSLEIVSLHSLLVQNLPKP